ncbi:V-type ATPase 116 kDa subunit [Thiorhodococcus drewsii AZ1]|uniref:V-type ATPase 116 kDa subunit n=1 Tax=Thiorhodococcus drewsii AZ1 TaxID=765913 RepID=G2E4Q3_9GAMM|nr:V-type ATPase 116kDa subunit family protein [Thiorhodococcus drewsii]EGV29529.1 V-type ATPase 116 kDa subunit [Thiorhodococcus drewsii AZ1]
MSILPLARLTLAGLTQEKHTVLERLQTLGCLHLLPLSPAPKEAERAPPAHAVETRKALRYLSDLPDKRRQVRLAPDFDIARTTRTVLDNQQRLRELTDRLDGLRQRLSELEPWGDFSLPAEDALAGRKLWFYIVPERQIPALQSLDLPWQLVHRDQRHAWVVVIHPEEPPHDALPVARTHTGALSLSAIRRQAEEAELALEEVQAERHALTRWIYLMSSHLAQAEDQARLRFAETQTLDDASVFLVQGWVAERDIPKVRALAETLGLALILDPPGPDDAPPTLLDNPPAIAAGQDLVGFYQMPAYRAWDPSRVLFFSFTLFFALILSDAGYAAVLGLLLAAYWRRLGRSDLGQRMRLMALALTSTSFVWGVLLGSYFGLSPPADSLPGQLKLFEIQDFDSMMKLSVGIGVLHLVLANAEMALIHRGRATGRVALCWIAALVGGFALWLGSDRPSGHWLSMLGQVLGIGGLIGVFLLGSDRRVEDIRSFALRVLDGLAQLVKVTQVFGDVLSYLRLFALGLASASLAITFNDLARQVAASHPGVGLLMALLILLVGHLLNLALSLMSGVVHGLRLNFIEFYNWALSGEGYPFKPFKKAELGE